MDIRTRATPIRALINSNLPRTNAAYQRMLDAAINQYERSKVVADRELELFAAGVEMPTQRWAVAVSMHNN